MKFLIGLILLSSLGVYAADEAGWRSVYLRPAFTASDGTEVKEEIVDPLKNPERMFDQFGNPAKINMVIKIIRKNNNPIKKLPPLKFMTQPINDPNRKIKPGEF